MTSRFMVLSRLLWWICRYWVALTLLLLFAIGFLSLQPLTQLPTVPGSDKTHHFVAYAALMLPTALRRPRYWWLLGLFFVSYSGVIELLQPLVNRYAEWLDLAANFTGVLIGAAIGFWLRRYVHEMNEC